MKLQKISLITIITLLLSTTFAIDFSASKVETVSASTSDLTKSVVYTSINQTYEVVEPSLATDLVTFNDSNLEKAVASALSVNQGEITVGDLQSITQLRLDGKQISDLTGLEYATNLVYLSLYNNQITDLTPLSGLTNLEALTLERNQVSDISPIAGLTNLTHLKLNLNPLSDISALSGLVNLQTLHINSNEVSDISALSGLVNLKTLYINNNQITDISALSGLVNLEFLAMQSQPIGDISALSELTSLTEIYAWDNEISDISVLSGLTNLETIRLHKNQISDISALSELTKLISVELYNNQISDISALSAATNLHSLYIKSNQISDISALKGATNLYNLDLSSNQISDISALEGATNLYNLNLSNNQITDLSPVVDHQGLRWVAMSNNQISDISPVARLVQTNTQNNVPLTFFVDQQTITQDDLVVRNDDERFYSVTDIDGVEHQITLGIPQLGTFLMEGNWDELGFEKLGVGGNNIRVYFTGAISQNITYKMPDPLSGNYTAVTPEETVLSQQELITLFEVVSLGDETISVDMSTIDFSTPGDYEVIFTDETGNDFIGTLTITDVLPVLNLNKDSVIISINGSLKAILSQLIYSATEIIDGDLTDIISINDSAVDYAMPGDYDIIFTASDEEGNVATKIVTVTINDDSTDDQSKDPTDDKSGITLKETGSEIAVITIILAAILIIALVFKRIINK